MKLRLLSEDPHHPNFPALQGLTLLADTDVDFCFENLRLPREAFRALRKAAATTGVRIPGTNHVIKTELTKAEIKQINGGEPELPKQWLRAVLATKGQLPIWVGKWVRPDQLPPNLDLTKYKETEDGWYLPR